jgi:hypothetical protein
VIKVVVSLALRDEFPVVGQVQYPQIKRHFVIEQRFCPDGGVPEFRGQNT